MPAGDVLVGGGDAGTSLSSSLSSSDEMSSSHESATSCFFFFLAAAGAFGFDAAGFPAASPELLFSESIVSLPTDESRSEALSLGAIVFLYGKRWKTIGKMGRREMPQDEWSQVHAAVLYIIKTFLLQLSSNFFLFSFFFLPLSLDLGQNGSTCDSGLDAMATGLMGVRDLGAALFKMLWIAGEVYKVKRNKERSKSG